MPYDSVSLAVHSVARFCELHAIVLREKSITRCPVILQPVNVSLTSIAQDLCLWNRTYRQRCFADTLVSDMSDSIVRQARESDVSFSPLHLLWLCYQSTKPVFALRYLGRVLVACQLLGPKAASTYGSAHSPSIEHFPLWLLDLEVGI